MNVLLYPLRYLTLTDEDRRRLLARNLLTIIVISTILSVPFIFSDANFFGERGFLDRFGGFCGVLTGFYIAALVGIASVTGTMSGLDKEIQIGKIYGIRENGAQVALTRREYVSAIFGYLAFVSFGLSVVAILLVATAGAAKSILPYWVGCITLCLFNLVLSHMIVTTCHGLYYFIDRIYYQEPTLGAKVKRD